MLLFGFGRDVSGLRLECNGVLDSWIEIMEIRELAVYEELDASVDFDNNSTEGGDASLPLRTSTVPMRGIMRPSGFLPELAKFNEAMTAPLACAWPSTHAVFEKVS